MDIEITRDGLKLRGRVEKALGEKTPALIIFHGFGGDSGYGEGNIYDLLANKARACGVTAVRFDFSGYGRSQGCFEDMDVLREILDAIAILQYVQSLPDITDIYLLGHSQGGVVAGMLAGLYPDVVKKLILLAPAATLKTDAQKGTCMGTVYDPRHIPNEILVDGQHHVGGHYFRIAKHLPIYEITSGYTGGTLLIHGIWDNVVDYHASIEYHRCMPNSRLSLYEELDHGIDGKDKEKVLEEIGRFIGSNDRKNC